MNLERKKEGNRNALLHKNLIAIIRDEFEEEINGLKIQPMFQTIEIANGAKRQAPYYNLTIAQAKQALVRESKFVRKAVIQYLDKLEERVKQLESNPSPFGKFENQVPTNFKEALLLAYQQQEKIEVLESQNKEKDILIEEYKPKVDKFDEMTSEVQGLTLSGFSHWMIEKHNLDEKRIEVKDIYRWFRENEYTCKGKYKYNKPRKQSLQNGYMTLKVVGVNSVGNDRTITVITQSGADIFEFLILRDVNIKQKWGWK